MNSFLVRLFAATMPFAGTHAASGLAGLPDSPPLIGNWSDDRAVCRALSLHQTKLGGFLGRHVDANNRQSLPAGLESPIPKAIEARAQGEDPPSSCKRLATDSDFYKWLEGACYAVAYDPSLHELIVAIDRYATLLVQIQEPDGYIGTRLSPGRPFDENARHDLYVAGHFIEAAVAHFNSTGDRRLLNAATRLADFYLRAFENGHPYFKLIGQEHPEIELALVRLHRATGEKRFLDFSAALTRMAIIGPSLADVRAGASKRHAVRLCYQLAGMSELFLETGDKEFFQHLPSLWGEIVSTRMYITGGIGYNEVVPEQPYDLPQTLAMKENRDIAETCASVSLMMYSWRMHAVTGDSRQFDVIETILYNHYLGAVSRDHLGIFYYNPLRRVGDLSRRTDHGGNPVQRTRLPNIHSTTCCMPNAWRFFAQLPEYVLSARKDGLCLNLYTDVEARHSMPDGTAVTIRIQTRYPHEGQIRLKISPDIPVRFAVHLRIPAWCEDAEVSVGDERAVPAKAGTYHRIDREWRTGDEVLLNLPMKPTAVFSPPQVEANRNQVAFRRGPLIYCLEKQDAAGLDLESLKITLDRENASRSVTEAYNLDLEAYSLEATAIGGQPDFQSATRKVRLIPFFLRANREEDPRWITWMPYEQAS